MSISVRSVLRVVVDDVAHDVCTAGNYILTYLARKGTMLRPFAITALIQLLCRITKLGWFDTDGQLRKVVTQTTTFLKQSVEHCIIGLKILNELVVEFNHRSSRRTITAHRKASVSFRDLSLLYTFEIGTYPPNARSHVLPPAPLPRLESGLEPSFHPCWQPRSFEPILTR